MSLGAIGTDIAEANESNEKDVIEKVVVKEEDKDVVVAKDGTITLAAVACTLPPQKTRREKFFFMESNLGGKQLHYGRNYDQVDFTYTFEAPKAGKYSLSARVVTPSPGQKIIFKVNGADAPVVKELPYTVGMWEETKPVEVTLKAGKNVFVCSRGNDNVRGLTIKDFTLKPKF